MIKWKRPYYTDSFVHLFDLVSWTKILFKNRGFLSEANFEILSERQKEEAGTGGRDVEEVYKNVSQKQYEGIKLVQNCISFCVIHETRLA